MRFIGQDPSTQPRRNLIINGTGMINQRSYVTGAATAAANEYTLDRWRVVTSGQSLAYTGNNAGRTMTAPAGGAEQVVEGVNIAGGTYVLNWDGTATATVGGNAVAKGGTVTLAANTNATLRLTSGTFTSVQLELGSVATPFEHRSYVEELALCQRYYEGSKINLRHFTTASGQYLRQIVQYAVEKRATPTVTGVQGSQSNIEYNGTNSTFSTNTANFDFRSTGAASNGYSYYTFSFDAEL